MKNSERMGYLLRNEAQMAAFRAKYGKFVEKSWQKYAAWIMRMPLCEWVPLVIREGQEEPVMGIISLLYQEGSVNVTLSEDGSMIMREPNNEKEYQEFLKRFSNIKQISNGNTEIIYR